MGHVALRLSANQANLDYQWSFFVTWLILIFHTNYSHKLGVRQYWSRYFHAIMCYLFVVIIRNVWKVKLEVYKVWENVCKILTLLKITGYISNGKYLVNIKCLLFYSDLQKKFKQKVIPSHKQLIVCIFSESVTSNLQ